MQGHCARCNFTRTYNIITHNEMNARNSVPKMLKAWIFANVKREPLRQYLQNFPRQKM